MANKRKTANAKEPSYATAKDPTKPLIQLSEEEQWRLINESGILHKVGAAEGAPSSEGVKQSAEEETPLAEEIFDAVVLIIPFTFLLVLMEILIHRQYGKEATLKILTDKLISSVPILSVFIFYTTRYKAHRTMQFGFFIIAGVVGPRMVYLLSRGSWLVNMKQCPPLATIWVYTIFQLDLGPAVLNLIGVAAYVWWKGLKFR
ncbi:uncharacterized protein BT62DRAFT_888232 [Guyanagaster necrorhizus]|uniref:DUF7719 domain-containing protein n=1 Tax=Guyanagaster necrorhizus TaxID=856835 RepID=A0A9P8AVN1_9AGAR|nr:uncharacterized protein BT62DRAFT_888232 [Guyanagaster necrorhizus MCA 3950]KAG7449271.1 hypothetical protein BT62DRAFT_888232 [Guyanagaster necrorhizus MCA 3950]